MGKSARFCQRMHGPAQRENTAGGRIPCPAGRNGLLRCCRTGFEGLADDFTIKPARQSLAAQSSGRGVACLLGTSAHQTRIRRASDAHQTRLGAAAHGAAGLFCSFFRSESKARKTALSHGLTGLAAIKPGAKKGPEQARDFRRDFGGARRQREPDRQGWQSVLGRFPDATRPMVWPATGFDGASKAAPRAGFRVWAAALGLAGPVPLQKQERIQGPKNASIARFFGLGCYQIRSGKGAEQARAFAAARAKGLAARLGAVISFR